MQLSKSNLFFCCCCCSYYYYYYDYYYYYYYYFNVVVAVLNARLLQLKDFERKKGIKRTNLILTLLLAEMSE